MYQKRSLLSIVLLLTLLLGACGSGPSKTGGGDPPKAESSDTAKTPQESAAKAYCDKLGQLATCSKDSNCEATELAKLKKIKLCGDEYAKGFEVCAKASTDCSGFEESNIHKCALEKVATSCHVSETSGEKNYSEYTKQVNALCDLVKKGSLCSTTFSPSGLPNTLTPEMELALIKIAPALIKSCDSAPLFSRAMLVYRLEEQADSSSSCTVSDFEKITRKLFIDTECEGAKVGQLLLGIKGGKEADLIAAMNKCKSSLQ